MTMGNVRDWLGKYFLLTTFSIGLYILLFGGKGSVLLRIDDDTANNCMQIVIPTLLAQLTLMFQFFVLPGSNVDNEKVVDIPSFVIRWPPILVTFGFILTVALMAIGGKSSLSPDQEQFKKILTFFVSLLNATTVLVVARIFKKPINGGGPAAPLGPGQ